MADEYDFEAGPEDEVMRREAARAWERYKAPNGDMWQSILPLVRALLALLAALGAKSLREALARAANPVRQAIDEDDRKTAERWARATQTWWGAYMGAAEDVWDQTPPELREPQIAAMLPLVREARQARADALAEHSSAGWAVVAEVGKILGLREGASTKAIVDDVRRLAERLHVETKLGDTLRGELDAARAEVARLKSAPGKAWERLRGAVQFALDGEHHPDDDGEHSLVSRRAMADLRNALAAVESPAQVADAPDPEDMWQDHRTGRGVARADEHRGFVAGVMAERARAEQAAPRAAEEMTLDRLAAGHVQRLNDGTWEWSHDGGFDQGVVRLSPHVSTLLSEVADAWRTEKVPTVREDDPPDSVDPRRMRPDSEEWVERAPGLSVYAPKPEACNVDHSGDKRPAVLGGECAKCLHRPPLHEATCTKARCDGHGQAPSLAGSMARDLLDKLPHGGGQ